MSTGGGSPGAPHGGLRAGKLPPGILRELLASLPRDDPRLLIGPGIGEDAAAVSFGTTALIAKTDPVTFATDLIGWYAVHVNANDIAATGGTPKWFLPTVLLPEGEAAETAARIFGQVRDAAESIGVQVIGGHTEITAGLPRPIVCGMMLGEAPPGELVRTGGAKPGDSIVLTKGIAVEGTSLLAREFRGRLLEAGMAAETLDEAADYLFDPGISVLREARAAVAAGGVTAMHDPTEGGLATALAELAEASSTGLEVDEEAVPVLPECAALCRALGVDPWGLISSGALLLTVTPERIEAVMQALEAAGVIAAVIGRVREREHGLRWRRKGEKTSSPLPVFARDEIARLFEE